MEDTTTKLCKYCRKYLQNRYVKCLVELFSLNFLLLLCEMCLSKIEENLELFIESVFQLRMLLKLITEVNFYNKEGGGYILLYELFQF